MTRTIFAFGLRSPFRSSFDRLYGNLYIGDVGQDTREEIDFIVNNSPGGQNFGWRPLEGYGDNPGVPDPPPPGAGPPIFDYLHSSFPSGAASVTGGYVYRGGDVIDNGTLLDGTYIFGDFVNGRIFSFRQCGTSLTDFQDRSTQMNVLGIIGAFRLTSFGEEVLGRLYAIDFGGQVYRIIQTPEPTSIILTAIAMAGVCV